MFITRS